LFKYNMTANKKAVIIGAGPAGLTAAYELLIRTGIEPLVLEATGQIGGISQTVEYKGNRMDIGGHRFFSKSDRVMNWWLSVLPLDRAEAESGKLTLTYHNRSATVDGSLPAASGADPDKVMLVRNRLSRIYYGRKFYSYPVRLDVNTIKNLGLKRMARIGFSYFQASVRPVRPEKNLEDFFINRFGRELYLTFFKDYTEKVWGVACSEIRPEWGAQRVRGLSVSKALWHAVRSVFPKERGIRQKETETSLIERFLYPKFGPGQLWQEVASNITTLGGTILYGHSVQRLEWDGARLTGVWAQKIKGPPEFFPADYVLSTMPLSGLIRGMGSMVPQAVREVAEGLQYRDFIAVGLLYRKMDIPAGERLSGNRIPDNWIYIQEPDVKVGRIQVFNNWSPFMVKDPDTVWLGLEYFCQEGDSLWTLTDEELVRMGIAELDKIGFCAPDEYLDGTVVRMPKTYPAYFGTFNRFEKLRSFTDSVDNLFLIGRNGMHRYNNQDHSMLTAMTAVDLIAAGSSDKAAIWAVNTEEEYHESTSQ
jgi:protoporphyrinogen oxidase